MDSQPTRQAIHRKPLPRKPSGPLATEKSATATTGPRHADVATGDASSLREKGNNNRPPGLNHKFSGLSLNNGAASGGPGSWANPPRRQETDWSFLTAPPSTSTWPSTRPKTAGGSTSATSSGRRSPLVGQFGPGVGKTLAGEIIVPVAKTTTTTTTEVPFWKTALDETRFFAGGLLPRPFESTKHYTVLRHSPGLIMYRGPTTSVVVTVFSAADHPVPLDRTVWLQRRGFSGDTGLRLKTLVGASGSWLEVTPARQASAAELSTVDERGFQRDIAKVLKKAQRPGERVLANRQSRETLVVRIPAAAADGYFRLVVCTGGTPTADGRMTRRKVLCGSPVFRVASTSTDASVFRGASLRTLPLEAGVKIASFIGTNAASTAAQPVVAKVQERVAKYQPGTLPTMVATEAYAQSGMQERVARINERVQKGGQRGQTGDGAVQPYEMIGGDGLDDDDTPPEVIGPDSGPEKPFPLAFQGRVVRGTGCSMAELGVPTANLAGTPDAVRTRLRGLYFGWATVLPHKGADGADARLPTDWIEALVAVGPSPWAKAAAVVTHSEVAVHLLYDLGAASLVDARIKVVLQGFVRAAPLAGRTGGGTTASLFQHTDDDARAVVSSLSRPAWGPQATLVRMETERSSRSLSDKVAEKRERLQQTVDRVPLHWAGVRTSDGERRDQLYGTGGFWIPR